MADEERDDRDESGDARTADEKARGQIVFFDERLVDARDRRIRMRDEIGCTVAGQIRRDAAERRDDANDEAGGHEFAPLFDQSEEHQAEREKLAVERRVIDGQMDVNSAEIHWQTI